TLKIGVDHISIKNKKEKLEPLINWSIQQQGYSAVTLTLLNAGSVTHTQKGLISSQQEIAEELDDMGNFPNSLELAIQCHDPETNDQSAVITKMIDSAGPKDIASLDLLEAFGLNEKDADFSIMGKLLNKSEKGPTLTALNLLKKTQNVDSYTNHEHLKLF